MRSTTGGEQPLALGDEDRDRRCSPAAGVPLLAGRLHNGRRCRSGRSPVGRKTTETEVLEGVQTRRGGDRRRVGQADPLGRLEWRVGVCSISRSAADLWPIRGRGLNHDAACGRLPADRPGRSLEEAHALRAPLCPAQADVVGRQYRTPYGCETHAESDRRQQQNR